MQAPLSLLDHLLRYLSPSISQWSFRIRRKNFGEIKTFSPWYRLLPVYLKLNFSFGTLSIPWSIWFIALITLYDTVLIVLSVHLNYIISPMRAGTYLLLFFPHVPKSWSEPQEKLNTYLLKQYHLYANPLIIFQFYFLYFQSQHLSCIFETTENTFYLVLPSTKLTGFIFHSHRCFWLNSRKARKCWLTQSCAWKSDQSVFKTKCPFFGNVCKFQSYFIVSQLTSQLV